MSILALGAVYGVISGLILAGAEVLLAMATGEGNLAPFRSFASILLGRNALTVTSVRSVLVIGSIVHVALSAVFGALYCYFAKWLSVETRERIGRAIPLGDSLRHDSLALQL